MCLIKNGINYIFVILKPLKILELETRSIGEQENVFSTLENSERAILIRNCFVINTLYFIL